MSGSLHGTFYGMLPIPFGVFVGMIRFLSHGSLIQVEIVGTCTKLNFDNYDSLVEVLEKQPRKVLIGLAKGGRGPVEERRFKQR